tara:strand:- start:538 stop:1263 length:726 start_codon:yes stop_codon:yes gene_type:complete
MRTNREEIEYHNRKFKYSLSGVAAAGVFNFDLQPPNEFAFSDRYSQALIKINHAYLSNRADTVNHGLDAVFIDAAAGVQLMSGGCLVMTDIKTINQGIIGDLGPAAGASGYQLVRNGIHAVLHNSRGSTGVRGAAAFSGQLINGASEVVVGTAAAGAGAQGLNANVHRVSMWDYKDDRSIEEAGVLCPNPFGKKMEVRMFSANNPSVEVLLTSAANLGVAISNGSSLNLELEILMLPNPTP